MKTHTHLPVMALAIVRWMWRREHHRPHQSAEVKDDEDRGQATGMVNMGGGHRSLQEQSW